MCYGFSAWISRDGKIYFAAPFAQQFVDRIHLNSSHSTVLLELLCADIPTQHLVPVEVNWNGNYEVTWDTVSMKPPRSWPRHHLETLLVERAKLVYGTLPIALYRILVWIYPESTPQTRSWLFIIIQYLIKKVNDRQLSHIPGYVPTVEPF